MEHTTTLQELEAISESNLNPFITANTIAISLNEMQESHIIPVFVKDNEPAISHATFIESVSAAAETVFGKNAITVPDVRVSHPVKGRIPEAKYKRAEDLLENEKTLYYERMAFVIRLKGFRSTVDGKQIDLTIGGVKAYNQDKLSGNSRSDQNFKVFVGWQVKVCTNLCVSSDGFKADIKARDYKELMKKVLELFKSYSMESHLDSMSQLTQYGLSESQFAHVIGRMKLYSYMPNELKTDITPIGVTDHQLNEISQQYFKDPHFGRNEAGDLSLWQMYNLITGANKSSYIDTFLDRSASATSICTHLKEAISDNKLSWYLT